MPFTVSHSAAVLPFLRSRHLSATGLIIGTMAPDFEYFFRLDVKGIYGHTLLGIFYFDLPVSILLAFLFHNIAKANLIDQSPIYFQRKFQETRLFDFTRYFKSHWFAFIISAIIGTITHIVWDAFTHQHQFFVKSLPGIYEGRTIPFHGAKYPLWYALQVISTIVGGLFLGIYFLRMKLFHGTYNRFNIVYWILLLLIIAVVVAIRMQFPIPNEPRVVVVIAICSAFCLGITILGFIPFKRKEIQR